MSEITRLLDPELVRSVYAPIDPSERNSIPTLLDRAHKLAIERAGVWLALLRDGPADPVVELDKIKITMTPGLFRPRFSVSFPLVNRRKEPRTEYERMRARMLDSLVIGDLISKTTMRGSMNEWRVYQGWLMRKEREDALRQIQASSFFGERGHGKGGRTI